ncbi:hypothetical protein V8B55DRAFT_1562469 [Mucor lusitanicus]
MPSFVRTLSKRFHLGSSFSTTNSSTKIEYQACKNELKRNKSLRSLNLIDCLVSLMGDESFDDIYYNLMLWSFKPDHSLTPPSEAFLEIIKQHSICSFHLVCITMPEFVQNHKKTRIVENVIPSLLALTKITGFVEFECSSNLKDYDYDLRSAPLSKLIDALGVSKTQNNMELIIVEALRSNGAIKKNALYTIEDSLKIIECSILSSLKKRFHIIQTPCKTPLHDKDCSELTEDEPIKWNERFLYIHY